MAMETGPKDMFLSQASRTDAMAILGAMRAVAEAGGQPASEAARRALVAAYRYLFRQRDMLDVAALEPPDPLALAKALSGRGLSEDATKFLTIMAFIDGHLDQEKIAAVMRYATALGVKEVYLDEVAEVARGHVKAALADMTRLNIESITGQPWTGDDATAWILPYTGANADPTLVARFETLGALPTDTFGHAFWSHFKENGYAFPGAPEGLNAAFSIPHDSVHVLTGYDTHPRGELLASTFTAAMHRRYPMAGHILPVIFSWHLGLQINKVAGDASGALDPEEFWHAWAAGEASPIDTFAPEWDFWQSVGEPLGMLRQRFGLPISGLDTASAELQPRLA
jgi:hypothetical protein